MKLAADTGNKYPHLIVGFKTGHYGGKFDEKRTPWASINAVVEAGRLTEPPVLADFTPMPAQGHFPARSYREFLLEKMRPGDIVTHCLANRYPFLMDDGTLNPDVTKARARGVKCDLGHARRELYAQARGSRGAAGFYPGFDQRRPVRRHSRHRGDQLVQRDLRIVCLGVPLEEAIRRTTWNPAQMIHRPELGNLSVGSTADIGVFEMMKGNFAYRGSGGGKIMGDKKLQCVLTMFNGEIVYDHPYGLSIPLWQDIPKNSRYWADKHPEMVIRIGACPTRRARKHASRFEYRRRNASAQHDRTFAWRPAARSNAGAPLVNQPKKFVPKKRGGWPRLNTGC